MSENNPQQAKYLRELVQYLSRLDDARAITKFLKAVLTPKELAEIPKRLQIVKLLKKGMPQREIAEKLGVGIATVTRGSKEVQLGNFRDVK